MTAREVLDGIRGRLAELQEDRAKAAMWRTTDVARLVAAVESVLGLHSIGAVSGEAAKFANGYNEALRQVRAAIEAALKEDPQ